MKLFVRASVDSFASFFHPYFFLISPSFGAPGELCFVSVAFPGYIFVHSLGQVWQGVMVMTLSIETDRPEQTV